MTAPAAAHRRAIALLAACGVLWSTGGLLIKLVDWHPLAIWSARSAIAAGTLWLLRRPGLRGVTRGEWAAAAALAATTGLFTLANKLTTAANAILIQYSAPVWVALLGAWLLGERAARIDWITIGLVIGGIALFFLDQLTIDHVAGNLVALAAGVAFAFSAVLLRRVAVAHRTAEGAGASAGPDAGPPPLDPLRPLFLGNLIGAALGAPMMLLDPAPGAAGWGALLALGVFQQAAAYLCYASAIRHATALDAMLVPVIEPILSPLWVALAFGERPGPWPLAGGAIVVGSVTLRALLRDRT